jgi:hypothetical protein
VTHLTARSSCRSLVTVTRVEDLEQFAATVARPEPELDVALALIAAHGRAGVSAPALVAGLDALAASCSATDAAALCAELFGPGGLRGDVEDYFDPRNSLLDQVLERRLGIPITLSAVVMEVGRRRGVGLVGVGMPGHFLVRDAIDPDTFLDPFRAGAPLDRVACRAIFERLHGPGTPFDPAFLEPAPPLPIVARVLANLHRAYAQRGDRSGLIRVLQLQSRLPGAGVVESRGLAQLLAADGRFDEAAEVHDRLAALDPDADPDHATMALRLRARLN